MPRAAGGLTAAVFVLKSTDLTCLHVCPLLASILPTTLLRHPVLSHFHARDDTQASLTVLPAPCCLGGEEVLSQSGGQKWELGCHQKAVIP